MKISEINIYPVKSLKGFSTETSLVEDRGLKNDRRFMVIDRKNDLVTQRELPVLTTISAIFDRLTLQLSTNAGNNHSIAADFDGTGKITVRVWDSYCEAIVADEITNQWFSELANTDLRLVRMPETTRRSINQRFDHGNDIVSFADGYPLLVIGENSLADLNSRMEKKIPMNRFRPNLVISGCEAFVEDKWEKIRIGQTIFRATKPCVRCVITTIDQETGVPNPKEPLKTLASYRKSSDVFPDGFERFGLGKNDVLFGQNLVAENFGERIKVGDEVEIL